MIILPADTNHIPGMTIFDTLVRIVLRQGDDTPDVQLIAKNFHRLRHALTDRHPVAQGADNLMGILLLQLIAALEML